MKRSDAVGIQLFGGDVEQVREAVSLVDRANPDLIDINFGCPVRKVVCKDGGAGILRNLPKMLEITEAVIERATRPVTVKTRLGWNDDSIRIIEVARMLEETGIAALAVHARTRSQMYRGDARWEWLRRIRGGGGCRTFRSSVTETPPIRSKYGTCSPRRAWMP